jgi:hypothetical protein
MKRVGACILAGAAAAAVTVARSGHEPPIYPSFYPHQITLRTLPPGEAAVALRQGGIQAYLDGELPLADAPSHQVRAVETLGAFVILRIDPRARMSEDAACTAAGTVMRQAATVPGFLSHPYPVTPFHGDYLRHADLAAAARSHFADAALTADGLKVHAAGRLRHPDWTAGAADWDVEVSEVDAAGLLAGATFAVNGWLAPPWVRTGWFQAARLLGDAVATPAAKERLRADLRRLEGGAFADLAERVNLERDLVASLTRSCRRLVAGYTVKREYVNVEYSAGIENVGYDAIAGLNSPIFIRTVKLKDFPWNGELALGIGAAPAAAGNPIGGMTDPFGRFIGSAIGDPALLPAPYDTGWMLNRIADLPLQPRP